MNLPSTSSNNNDVNDDNNDDGGDFEDGDNGNDNEASEVHGDMSSGGMSGRKDWKERHKKGKFNPILARKNQHRQEGSFIKSKNYKHVIP